MEFLWWNVPVVTAPMLIALIATVHVFVSHYAVGGGLFLAHEVGRARRAGDADYLRYLRSHAKFFILLTVVFGAITGVGIWWTIGLASPLATEMLIRVFVFGWATEWVFFVVEIVAGFLFYYRWDKLPPRTHVAIGWVYAIAAWISLVLITGITAFMLDPGTWTDGAPDFWRAFLNPQFVPQTVARTGFALALAATYVLLHAAWKLDGQRPEQNALRRQVVRRTGMYAAVGVALAAVGVGAGVSILPEMLRTALLRAAALNLFIAGGCAAAMVLVLLIALAIWRPRWVTPLAALGIFCMALVALTATEFVREAVRKPFIVTGAIYGNQVRVSQVDALRRDGLLASGPWTSEYVAQRFPYVVDADGRLALERATPQDRSRLGRVVFMHHCNDCHAEELGYSGMSPLVVNASREELLEFVRNLNGMVFYMPPWCGNDVERELLVDFLETLREGR